MMSYDPNLVIHSYTKNADIEDQSEKIHSLRTEIPREFIRRYLKPTDVVLDAGGGTGVNAMMMAELCGSVTLLDLTPKMLEMARANIDRAGLQARIQIMRGDICNLTAFGNEIFSFVVCVGDALSYVLDQRKKAIAELVRVAKVGAKLILGVDSKYGFLRLRLAQGNLEEALAILKTGETYCGMGPRTHLYTVSEMRTLLAEAGCSVLEVAATPSVSDAIDQSQYHDVDQWEKLKAIELEICAKPELLGTGDHLLFVAQKE